jgi:hypothetical protein
MESAVAKSSARKNPAPLHAEHGAPSEVSWDGGTGRQPYANQGGKEAEPANRANEFAEGDRGELSGRNLEQLEEVTKMP